MDDYVRDLSKLSGSRARRFLCVLDSPVRPPDRWLWSYLPDNQDQADFVVAHSVDLLGGVGKAFTRYPEYFFNAYKALQSAKNGQYDAIVAWESKSGLPLALLQSLQRRRRPPLVLLTFSGKRYALNLNALIGRWLKQIAHLTVPSEWEATYYSRIFDLPSQKVSVCHLGAYDLRQQLPPTVTGPDRRQQGQYVFSGGRTDRDFETLFAAVAGSGIRTVVNTRPYIVRGLRRPAEVAVNDLMSINEYPALIARASAVIVPLKLVDHAAGLSMILDAMALGRPVICSAIPAVRDYVVDGVTGVFVPPGDIAALRAAILSAVTDPDRFEAMGRAARALYEDQFTFAKFAQRVYQVLVRVTDDDG